MPRRRIDIAMEAIDYKNPDLLKKFVSESGKILPRRVTGMPAHMHRKITREITIVCVRPGIGLVHSESRSFAAFGAGTQRALGHASHRIDYRVAKLKKLLFLLTNEGVQLLFAMV